MTSVSSDQGNFWVGLAFIVVVIIIIIVVLVKLSNKRMSKSSDEDGETIVTHWLLVTMDGEDKPKKFSVSGTLFNEFNIGDKIEKKLGELNPTKVV
jgi:hypothetical protein